MANMHTDLPALYGVLEPLNPLYRDLLRGVAEFERSGIFGEWNKAYPHPERSFGGAVDKVFEPGADPRTAQWPMVGAPALPLTIVFTYLVGIALASYFVRAVGFPKLKLTPLVFLHNLVCALLSVYMVWETALAFHELYDFRRLLDPQRMWCFPLDGIDAGRGKWESPAAHRLASIIYFHFLTKILELGDTCIMVFKQNWNQISFLHVYHHASVIITWILFLTYSPGGSPWFACCVNSLVHVFMYTCVQGSVQRLDPSANARPPAASLHRHYAARAVGINTPLKAALTSIQLIQFVLYLWHTVWVLLLPDPTSCSKPLVPIYLGMLQAAVKAE
ncbi:Elovl2 [Symbiodinium sp. KB8]|nr:Elovl2 [Symbiodinium sp. KB8]